MLKDPKSLKSNMDVFPALAIAPEQNGYKR